MKKLLTILCFLGVIALAFQLIVQFFIVHQDIKYSIATKDNAYLIDEKLDIDGKKNLYSFKVVDKNEKTYYFSFLNDYNRRERVIEDIKFFDEGDLQCIYPIYRNKKTSDVYCNYEGTQVSYSYLKQLGDSSINKIVKTLKSKKYDAVSWKKETVPKEISASYKFYLKNVPKDTFFTVWFYKGFYILKNGKLAKKEFLNGDQYENNLSLLTGNYYVSINTDMNSGSDYTAFYLYDVVNGGKGRLDLDEHISSNMYINGEYDGKFYYTDLSSKKQFMINPDQESVTEVGNVKDGFKTVQANKLVEVSAKDYLKHKNIWTNDVSNNVLKKKYGAKEVKRDKDRYYFLTEEGALYKVFRNDIEHPILLCTFDEVSEWKVKDSNVMVVYGDTMYYYNDVVGLLPIVVSGELKYNYKNICDFVVKQ